MILEIAIRYLHFISVFTIVASLVGEHLLLKDQMTRKEIKRLSFIDGIYGLAVITLLIAGMTLWFGVGKPAEFYSKNGVFHLKITLFVILGILSIFPTVFFAKARKGNQEELVDLPPRIKWFIRVELILLFIIPICASIMAKGIGYFGGK